MIISLINRPFYWTLLYATCLLSIVRWDTAAQPSPGQLFQARRSSTGEALCCMDAPASSLAVRSAVECALRCIGSSFNCAHFNVRMSGRSCELYTSGPACYAEIAGCTNYEVFFSELITWRLLRESAERSNSLTAPP